MLLLFEFDLIVQETKPQMFERASIAGRFKSEASSLHVPCGIKKFFFYKITRVAWKIRVGRVTGTTGIFFLALKELFQ